MKNSDKRFAQLEDLVRDIFPAMKQPVSENTLFTDVPGFDSLSRIYFVLAIEKTFSLQLTTRDVSSARTLGDLMAAIIRRERTH